MKLLKNLSTFASLASLIVLSTMSSAYAQASNVVRIIVPFAPGGTTDLIARIISPALSQQLGQTIVVENKSGAGGIVGTAEIAKAAPDGLTLGIGTASSLATNPAINPKLPYDPIKDFTPIVNIAATPNVIAVHPDFLAKNYKEFLAELKKNPGKHSFASSGTGGIGHLQMELYKSNTSTFITHIPYRGAGPALLDVVGGQVPVIFDNFPSAQKYITSKQLIPMVIASPKRLATLPGVPTFEEVGLKTVNRMAFYGLIGPKNMPAETVDRLNAAVKKVLADPVIRDRIEKTGSIVIGNSPADFKTELRNEFFNYVTVVNSAKLTLDR